MAKQQFEVFLVIGADGDYEAGTTEEAATEAYEANIGTVGGCRIIKLYVHASLPQITTTQVIVPDELETELEASSAGA